MSARKRKAPDRKKTPVRKPGLLVSLLVGAGRMAARNPRGIGGTLCVAVACSFVVANALWYQPGGHPHPFLRTRDPEDPNAIAGYRPVRREPPAEVTTFHIERASDQPPATPTAAPAAPQPIELPQSTAATAIRPAPLQDPVATRAPAEDAVAARQQAMPVPTAVPAPRPSGDLVAEDPVAAAIKASELKPIAAKPVEVRPPVRGAPQPPAEIPVKAGATRADQLAARATNASVTGDAVVGDADLIIKIQRGLVNIAYSDVKVDGVAGAQTRAAIRHFQKHYRLPETGEPSEIVLKKLKSIGAL